MNATQPLTEQLLDVRSMPPRQRHPTIFQTWSDLPDGGSFLLVNDHDPLPLYYQFACEHAGTFHWEYQAQGPEIWRVRIRKGQFDSPGFVPLKKVVPLAQKPPVEPVVLDTRPIFARGETPCTAIDAAVGQVAPGGLLVLLVPFEPVPLYTKLERDGFTHQALPQADGTWRIEFRRDLDAPAPSATSCGCGH